MAQSGTDATAKAIDAERERAVLDLVESLRKEKGEAYAIEERNAEVARQQSQGKMLPDDEIDKRMAKEVLEDSDVAAIKEDVATLQKEMESLDAEGELSVMLKKQLDEVTSYEKAADVAVPCVIKSILQNA